MKKILLLCSIALMFACSNENETLVNETSNVQSTTASRPLPPVEDATDEMFRDYVTSDIYLEVQGLISDFNNDLNTDIDFSSTDEMFSWISANLSTTSFTSISEATSRWNNYRSKLLIERSTFAPVYQFIADAPEEIVITKIAIWMGQSPVTSTAKSCEEKLTACSQTAANNYYHVAKYAILDNDGNNQTMDNARSKYERDSRLCSDSYTACINKRG